MGIDEPRASLIRIQLDMKQLAVRRERTQEPVCQWAGEPIQLELLQRLGAGVLNPDGVGSGVDSPNADILMAVVGRNSSDMPLQVQFVPAAQELHRTNKHRAEDMVRVAALVDE